MSGKKHKKRVNANRTVPKNGPVWHRSAVEVTLDKMPRYNGHICKTGVHGDTRYNRAKQNRSWKQELANYEARNRGPRPFPELFVFAGSGEQLNVSAM